MLRVDVESRRSPRSEDVLHDLEVRFPNIYNRRRQRRARQEALQLSDSSFSENGETSSDVFGRQDDRLVTSTLHTRNDDVWSSKQSGRRRHSSATFNEKEEKLRCENGLRISKWRLRSLEDLGNDGSKFGNGLRDSKSSSDSFEEFPRRYNKRRNTSPDVLFVPDTKSTALKERLKHNAERLNDLLYNKSPFSKGQGHFTPRSDEKVIWEKEENERVISLEGENTKKIPNGDARKPSTRFEMYRMMFENGDRAEKERKSDYIFNSRWRQNAERIAVPRIQDRSTMFVSQSPQQSPESQADSAIDVESASVQSELSVDNHSNDINCDINPTDSHKHFHEKDDTELTSLDQWSTNDSRNRPLHSLPDFVGDLAIRSLLSFSTEHEHSSGEESAPKSNTDSPRSLSPLVSPKRFRLQGQTTPKRSGPVRGDHNLSSTSPVSLSEREQQENYLLSHGFANGPLVTSSDDLDDAVDDTDPSIESPQPATPGRVHTKSRKQIYLVKTSSESPRYGRITPVSGPSEAPSAGGPSEGKILLDMRYHSVDQSSGKGTQACDMKSEHHHLKSLKSKSLNDVFDGDMDTKYKMILQNGGPGYKFDQENNNEYCSSTDSPLKSKSCISFNNFTLSPRTELEKDDEELIVVMDNIGESRTEDNLFDVQPSSESASISDQSVGNSESSSQRTIPAAIVHQASETPEMINNESMTVHCPRELYSSESDKFDQSFDSRTSDCDTEFFMEAEFLDSAMKPKKTTFQKLFGGKKGKYNPAAEDVSKLPKNHDQSKSNSVSKSLPNHDRVENTPGPKQGNHKTESPRQKAGQSETRTSGKDVRFSVVEENDQGCVNTFNGGLVRAGRISAFEAATLKESPELENLNLSCDGSTQFHSKPVVISSGKGSCLDMSCNSFSKDVDYSRTNKVNLSTITAGSSMHTTTVDKKETLEKVNPRSFQDSDSTITNMSLKSFPNSSMTTEETINSPQSPDTTDDVFEDSPRSLTSSLKSHQHEGEVPSFLSEGFDHHDSFEEKFHQDLKLNHSGSDFTSSHSTSNSPRSVWSEFEGPNTVDQSFEDSFESSFNASSLNARSFGDVLSKEDNSKDEREKSSGYASENSPQSSETKDDFMDEEKSSQRHDDVARAPFKDEVDRIFELAKDPPSFADDSDIEEELSFADLDRQLRSSTELSVVKEAAAESDSDVPIPGKDQKVTPADKQKMSKVPKPILSNHSPRMANSSKYSKNEDIEPASITSDDNNNENSDCMSSETSEVIRSAFDFLGSSSEVEPLASARETLMMLEEEDSEEEQDLASSIKMLSDLRRSLVLENQDILLADGILTEKDFPDLPIEEAEEPSQSNISEDEDSSFQLDPRPAGVHSEIQVDIHRPNVEDSDNGSEKDAPLDAMDDDSLFEGGPMLHPNPESEVTTPKPEDFEDDEHPLNRTYVVSVDFCEDNSLSEGQTSFGCELPKEDKSLADELKLPLWDDDQVSSGYSTPRAENQTNIEENLHETTLEESSSDPNTSFKENDCERTDTVTHTVTPNIAKDSSDNAKEETNEKRSGQRYIKKSQMDKKKILLRRQKESIQEDPNEDETPEDQTVDSKRASIRGDSSNQSDIEKTEPESPQTDLESNKSAKDQSPRSDQSEESRNFSGSFNRLSSGTGFYTDSVKEFSLDSGDSPRSLIQTDLPDASVNLSDEINVNASLDDVFFDDLNESFRSNHNHSSGPLPSTRAYAYRKSSEGEDSSSMMSEESSRGVPPDRKFSLPDVVLNQGSSFMPMSDSSIDISSLASDTEVVASSMENSMLSDIQEESYELSYNSFISPYATTKSLAKISSTPKSLYRSKTAELSCGVEPVYDPYSTIDSRGDNSNDSDRRCSSASDISPYATINDSLRLNDGVLLTSKDNVVEKSTENSTPSSLDIPDSVTQTIPEIRIQAPTDDEVGNESYTGKDVMDLYAKINKAQSKGDNQPESRECSPQHTASKGGNSAEPVEPEELGAVGGCEEVIETDDEGPPLPKRKYERSISSQSNLQSNREVSASRTSLFSNFKSSARDRFRTMRKAMSVDRGLDEAHQLEKKAEKKEKAEKGKEKNKKDKKDKKKKKEEKISKAPSLKSLTSIFGKKSKDKSSAIEDEVEEKKDEVSEKKIKKGRGSIFGSKKKRLVTVPIDIVDVPTHFRCIGKLKEVNPDGTQLVELNKPVDGPIGFYIAKGTANYDYGTFVSRFTDDQQKLFAGILGIGDEILEINEQSVKDMSLDDVHALMASTETLNMKIFPIVARKEV